MLQIEPPDGAQLLIFPIDDGVIIAGYRNPTYFDKNGYPHYGIDLVAVSGRAEVIASGIGIVLGTEFCNNSLGNIAVIRYDDVFVPQSGEIISLIARYYHMDSIMVDKDDLVAPGQAIGSIDGSHEQYHHIHMELDADVQFPFHTPQVAQSSSNLLNRFPANGDKILEPIYVLALGREQWIYVHPDSDCVMEKDNPRYAQKR